MLGCHEQLGGVMALIGRFEERPLEPLRVHAEVLCGYRALMVEGRLILQLETYGSTSRKMPDKVSQSLQFDRSGAAEMKRILERSFPGI